MRRYRYPPGGIRVRLALLFAGGFAVLLAAGGLAFYTWLARDYRADFDHELEHTATSARALFQHDRAEFHTAAETAAHLLTELVFVDRVLVAADSTGRQIASSLPYAGAPLADDLDLRQQALRPVTVPLAVGPARVLEVLLPEGLRLFIAMPMAPLEARLARLRVALLVGLPLILLAGALVGVVASRSALRPVTELAGAAHRMSEEVSAGKSSFSALPPAPVRDEIGTLTEAIDHLVAQAARTLADERAQAARQRAFLAETAHELRTPLAIIRNEAEVALRGGQANGSADTLRTIGKEAADLGELVGDLLALAREKDERQEARGEGRTARERQEARGERQALFLDDLAHEAVGRVRSLPVAVGRDIRLGEFEEAPVLANAPLMRRAVLALLHNALVHAAPSPVELSAGTEARGDGRWAWLRVRDWGPGIGPEDAARVFTRFERLDPRGGGSGLGLAIAQQVAQVHGGELVLEQPEGGGVAFVLRVPAAPAGPPG